MSCTNPQPYLVPYGGGRPKHVMRDMPIGHYRNLGRLVYLPCGGCIACRREKRQDYTCMQVLESLQWDDNWFLTLTYDDEHLPSDRSLKREHLSSFLESFRHYCRYNNYPVRYFAVGEYGDKYERPHYHLSLFGLPPDALGLKDDDSKLARRDWLMSGVLAKVKEGVVDENGERYWHSKVVGDRWPYGHHQIYRANRYTFQYVAGYAAKKLSGLPLLDFKKTGRIPSYFVQSRPSIGYDWWRKHHSRLSILYREGLINDAIDVPGMRWRIPRIMMKWLEREEGRTLYDQIVAARMRKVDDMPDRADLARKQCHDEHVARRAKQNNKHKEMK